SRPSAKQPARSAPPPATPASGGLTPLGPAAAQPPLDELLPPRGDRRNVHPLTRAPLTQSGLTPLEPAAPAPLADPAEPLGGTIPTGTPATRKVGKRKKGDNPWDSPLMLVGGGVLIV